MVIPHSHSYPHAKFEGNLLLFKFEPHTKSGLTIPQCDPSFSGYHSCVDLRRSVLFVTEISERFTNDPIFWICIRPMNLYMCLFSQGVPSLWFLDCFGINLGVPGWFGTTATCYCLPSWSQYRNRGGESPCSNMMFVHITLSQCSCPHHRGVRGERGVRAGGGVPERRLRGPVQLRPRRILPRLPGTQFNWIYRLSNSI